MAMHEYDKRFAGVIKIESEGLKWPQEVTICILKCQEIPGEIIELSTLKKKIIPTLRIHIGFWIRQQFQDWR